jgi:hypothetical protein
VRSVVVWSLIAIALDQQINIGRTLMSAPNDPSIIWRQLMIADKPEKSSMAKLLAVPHAPSQIFLPYQACGLSRYADC